MKWNGRMNVASHLLAAAVGVAIWQAVAKKPQESPVAHDTPSHAKNSRDPAEAEVLLRLGAWQVQNSPPPQVIEEPHDEPEPGESKSLSQILLEMREVEQADLEMERQQLLKKSETFRHVKDLGPPLMEALTMDDQDQAALGIFIEWHRRDPAAAFNELAARPIWTRTILTSEAMVLHLTPEVLLDQLDARNRSSDFRESVIEGVAEHWVTTDDLRGLSSAYDKLGGNRADALMEEFLDNRWVPRDGAASLALVEKEMSPSCRKAFLTKLLGLDSNDPSREWVDGMAAPLLREVLGEAQVASLRKEAAEREANRGEGWGCGGGGEEEYYQPDEKRVAELMAEITEENASSTLQDALGRMLLHDQDYPELFGAGKISAEEICQAMISRIPGAGRHEKELRKVLYQNLARWNPASAVEWASAHLSEEDLQSVAKDADMIDYEPRASRMLDLMEALPLDFQQERYVGYLPWRFHLSLLDWLKMDAEAANQAMSRNARTQEIADKMINPPSLKEELNNPSRQ